MAAKDSNDKSKTSKTARVMNLLSKKQDPAPPSEESGESAALPPIISSLAPDAAVSGQIKDALTDLLEQELGTQASSAAPEPEPPVREDPPAPAPAEETSAEPAVPEEPPAQPVQEEDKADFVPLEEIPAVSAETPVQKAAPAPQAEPEPESAPASQAEPEPESAPPAPQAMSSSREHTLEQQQNGGYINVMQVLVEEKAEKYIKLFGLCECERCRADVKALTLNHLPSKYVVLEQGEMIPKLTFYENKYNSDITTQLLHACKVVMDTPHHTR